MTIEIVEYSKTEAALSDLAQRYKGVIFAVATIQEGCLNEKETIGNDAQGTCCV